MFEILPQEILFEIIVKLKRSKHVANLYLVNRFLNKFITLKAEKLKPLILRHIKTDKYEYYEFMNGIRHDLEIEYPTERQPKLEKYYDHGIITMVRQFDFFGKVWMETPYDKNGEKHGQEVEYWSESGNFHRTANFEHGKRQGYSMLYHNNGSLFSTAPYVDDKLHGEVKNYYSDGKLLAISRYINGESIPSEYVEYDESGDIVSFHFS